MNPKIAISKHSNLPVVANENIDIVPVMCSGAQTGQDHNDLVTHQTVVIVDRCKAAPHTILEVASDRLRPRITASPTILSALPKLMAPRMTDPHFADQLANAACHEAGHAVSAFHLGGRLNAAGVTIDGNWYCGARFPVSAAAEQIHIPFTLAGDCAEFALIGETEPSASRAQVADALRAIQSRIPFGDLEWAMATFRKNHPHASDDALFELYEMYVDATHDMLQEPNIRRAVEWVASKLLTRGRLSSEEVARIYRRATIRRFKKSKFKKAAYWAVQHDH